MCGYARQRRVGAADCGGVLGFAGVFLRKVGAIHRPMRVE
jgi:hypothetical protein